MELHDFGNGHGPIPAHRHLNPDGCLGCWVPDDWNVAPDMYALWTIITRGDSMVLLHQQR